MASSNSGTSKKGGRQKKRTRRREEDANTKATTLNGVEAPRQAPKSDRSGSKRNDKKRSKITPPTDDAPEGSTSASTVEPGEILENTESLVNEIEANAEVFVAPSPDWERRLLEATKTLFDFGK